jgi:hypothetical protein
MTSTSPSDEDANNNNNGNSAVPSSSRHNQSKLIKFGAIGAAVAALAIIMLPGISLSSLSSLSSSSSSQAQTQQDSFFKTDVPLTEQELTICNSVHDQLDSTIIPGDNHTAAVDLLNGVYCNRADLVHALGSSNYPAIGLTSYACEATRGTLQDQEASDELQQFKDIYCASAQQSLQGATGKLSSIANSLKQISDYSLKAQQISAILDNSTSLADQSPYAAYKELDRAAAMVTSSTNATNTTVTAATTTATTSS